MGNGMQIQNAYIHTYSTYICTHGHMHAHMCTHIRAHTYVHTRMHHQTRLKAYTQTIRPETGGNSWGGGA